MEKDIENFHRLERSKDLDILLDRIGDSQFVLLGEASHGTSEFYRWRTEITKRLINEKGFSFWIYWMKLITKQRMILIIIIKSHSPAYIGANSSNGG